MDKDERAMLTRLDEWASEMKLRHHDCTIPIRVAALEKHQTRVEAGIAILVFLVGSGRVIDLIYTVMHTKL